MTTYSIITIMRAALLAASPFLPKCLDSISLTHILWLLGALPTGKDGRGTKLLTIHAK